MTKANRQLTASEMRAEIKRLHRIKTDVSEYKTIKMIYQRLFAGIKTVVGTTSGGDVFFRARTNPPSKPSLVAEIAAPPASSVTGYQRCNAPHQPLFYCSSRRITALLECRIKVGDTVYLSQWIGKSKLPINMIFDTNEDHGFFRKVSEAESILYTHLDAIFSQRIHDTFSNDYKFSAAVYEQLTRKFESGRFGIEQDGCVGIRYPSVIDLEDSFNIAFPAHFTPDRIEPLFLMELRVERIDGNDVTVSLLDTAFDFSSGSIRWTGNRFSIPAPRPSKTAVNFRWNETTWELLRTDHLSMPEELVEALLNELLKE